jgi:hypothetical protein
MKVTRIIAGVGFVLTLLTGMSARAQLLQPTFGENNGIKVGDGRLHVYLDLEGVYDSAALVGINQCGATATATALCPEIVGHIRPGFALDVPSNLLHFVLNGNLDYVWYTGLLTHGDTGESRAQGGANLGAAFNQAGVVEADVTDLFSRSDRPTDPSLGVGVLSLYNQATLALPIHPPGGALVLTPSGSATVESFSPIVANSNGTMLSNANYVDFQGALDGRWKFLPKTALVLTATIDDRRYSVTGSANPLLLRAQAGMAGLVTPRVAVNLKAGWGVDFSGSDGSTFIGVAEATYLINALSSFKLGVLRDLLPVSTYGTTGDTRAYAGLLALVGGRLQLHGTFSYDLLNYYTPASIPTGGTAAAGRRDNVFTFDVGPQYEFLSWLVGAVGYQAQWRDSTVGTSSPTITPGNISAPILNYFRNEVYGRLTFTY